MKNFKSIAIISLALSMFLSCSKKSADPAPDTTTPVPTYSYTSVAVFPGSARDATVSFTLNNKGYVGLGENSSTKFQDFYRYDPTSNTWASVPTFGGVARRGAVAFVLGDTVYVGQGYGYTTSWNYLNDFWKYSITTNVWTPLNNFPYQTSDGVSFVINNVAYVVNGNELRQYNHLTDSWVLKATYPGQADDSQVAFTIGSKAYVGTGYVGTGGVSECKDFWEYDPTTNVWTRKADLPANTNSATAFSLGNYGFVGTGVSNYVNKSNFYRYDPANNSWVAIAAYAGGSANGLASFVVGTNAYIGTGWTTGYTTSFYKFQ
jgi:N-acetylneuraminic acid mutarotase